MKSEEKGPTRPVGLETDESLEASLGTEELTKQEGRGGVQAAGSFDLSLPADYRCGHSLTSCFASLSEWLWASYFCPWASSSLTIS